VEEASLAIVCVRKVLSPDETSTQKQDNQKALTRKSTEMQQEIERLLRTRKQIKNKGLLLEAFG
jgi:hypothetical protein